MSQEVTADDDQSFEQFWLEKHKVVTKSVSAKYFATFVVPTYNQADYIRKSLSSVLKQDCDRSEILVADDCSQDATFDIVQEMLETHLSHHDVKACRNKVTLGSGNIMALSEEASANYIVAFHGDDVFSPDRAKRLVTTMRRNGASLISSNAKMIDASGRSYGDLIEGGRSGFLELSQLVEKWTPKQTGSTLAFERAVIDDFLPWQDDAYWFAGDHVLPFRAALLGGSYYLDEALLERRQHASNQGREMKLSLNKKLTRLMQEELRSAHYLAVRSFMLRDTEYYAQHHGQTERTRQAVSELRNQLNTHLLAWSKTRTRLLNCGSRPSWIDSEQFKAAIDTSSAIKGNSGVSSLFRKVYKRLTQFFRRCRG